MESATMARPKRQPKVEPKAETKPPVAPPSPSPVFSIKGDPEWRAWVDDLAEHCRMTNAGLVDAALVEYARLRGFTKAAPPRFSK